MTIQDDSSEFANKLRARVGEMVEKEGEQLDLLPVAAETAEERPYGLIEVRTQRWRLYRDATSDEAFNPTAKTFVLADGWAISTRPKTLEEHEAGTAFVEVLTDPPQISGVQQLERMEEETLDEWRARVRRDGANGSIGPINLNAYTGPRPPEPDNSGRYYPLSRIRNSPVR